MYFIYSLVYTCGFLILLPRFLLDALRHGKYVAGFRERLGGLSSFNPDAKPVIWLHCVSVGETQAARPLVAAIQRKFPNHRLVVSTVTSTGQELARQVFGENAHVIYFPFDWRWTARRSLKAIKPSVVLILETELWPGFLRECKARDIPAIIVNGRLSEASFHRFSLVPGFVSKVVNCLDLALMQTDADASRMRQLGLAPDRIVISGNLKFDALAIDSPDSLTEELRQRFSFGESGLVILAASTHAPEERIMLEALQQMARGNGFLKPRLIIAPRHPERFAEVASLLSEYTFRWVRRTNLPSAADRECEVLILDTIGELRSVLPLATVVFVGGSIAPTGGHNILEPAAIGACIVTGPHTENFKEIVAAFVEADAIVQLALVDEVKAATAIAATFNKLIDDGERRRVLGTRAKTLVEQHRGATDRTIGLLAGYLNATADERLSLLSSLERAQS